MKGLKKLIAGFAPTLASALGGPLAGGAVKFIGDALFGKDTMNDAELEMAIANATPEELGALKKIDNDYKIAMGQQGIDVFKLETVDTQNARAMAIVNMWPQIILSIVFISGYFGLVYMLFSGQVKIDESIRDLSNILIGVMTANIPQIMAFWFGSSIGSKGKDSQK